MDVIGWNLLTLAEDRGASGTTDTEDGTNCHSSKSDWWISTVFDVTKSSSRVIRPEQGNNSLSVISYTSFSEMDASLNSSTESLPGWEKLSDSFELWEEEQCHSLPACGTGGMQYPVGHSNTVWYAELEKESDRKDLTLKNKVISAWTNVTNGWVLNTTRNFKFDSDIWLLGRKYPCCKPSKGNGNKTVSDLFKMDFASRIWLTYRINFPTLPSSSLKSDVGWGCMLRSGQMMLAQGLINHFLGRDWLLSSSNIDPMDAKQRQIIRYFGDFSCDDCPFSIHKLIEFSHTLGRQTGDWFGPASICVALREAFEKARSSSNHNLSELVIYLTMDCTVYKQDVIDLCTEAETSPSCVGSSSSNKAPVSSAIGNLPYSETLCDPSSSISDGLASLTLHDQVLLEALSPVKENWKSLIVLMPLRLGSETLNNLYIPCIKKLLENDLCIGIIGGRPRHSLYFIGWQDESLIHLDPHCCQKTVNVLENEFPFQTYHCFFPRKLLFSKMDPTCAIGFYCKTRQDFERFVEEIPQMTAQPSLENTPLFSFQEGRRADVEQGCLHSMDTFRTQKNS